MVQRWGVTIPLSDQPLRDQVPLFSLAEELGYTDLWSSEVNGTDGFTPLVLAAQAAKRARLGTAIVSTYTRGPLILAMHAASLNEVAPGRVVLGLGSASLPIVEWWNGVKFDRPLSHVRDTTEVVRRALAGENVTASLPTVEVRRAKYTRAVEPPVPIYLAALRPKMLALAGQVADGVIINLLSAGDVPKVVKVVRDAAEQAGRDPSAIEVVCRIFVCASEDRAAAGDVARRFLAGYLTVPTYTKFQQWLGRGEILRPTLDAWAEGDRKKALAVLPNEVVDELVLNGTPDYCRGKVIEYCKAGVDLPLLQLFKTADQPADNTYALRALAPVTAPALATTRQGG
ncbi:MAG: LLM class F420-dependent oxidoreductase [Chloroflexi bacterium]|nr:LLM class F420-dependent oxidoreductase [Chloroflexota bacterium]